MTVKQFYENIYRELRKTKAPSLHLEDFLYFANKGIQEYINLSYRVYQHNQQLTDDLQPLVNTAEGVINHQTSTIVFTDGNGAILSTSPVTIGKRYDSNFIKFNLFPSYQHWLGAHTTIANLRPTKCKPAGSTSVARVQLLTKDVANQIMTNVYARPDADYGRVYYTMTDGANSEVMPSVSLFFGRLNTFRLNTVSVDYLKNPSVLFMTDAQVVSPIDTTATLEFPEYVCNELIKHTVKLILELNSDPRLQTHIPINNTLPRIPEGK